MSFEFKVVLHVLSKYTCSWRSLDTAYLFAVSKGLKLESSNLSKMYNYMRSANVYVTFDETKMLLPFVRRINGASFVTTRMKEIINQSINTSP